MMKTLTPWDDGDDGTNLGGRNLTIINERIFAEDCTHVPSPEALDAVYRRPCSCASIRHHARSSFANSGKFTKFKCKIGRCSAGSMEARVRRRTGWCANETKGKENTEDRKIDIGTRSVRASEKGLVRDEAAVRGGSAQKRRREKRKARARTEYIDR